MEATSILLVDDTPTSAELIQRHLTRYGCRVLVASGVDSAVRLLDQTPVDIVVTDLRLADGSGMDLVRHVRQRLPDTEVMLVTGYASIEGAVDAVRQGASEYVVKPFTHEELVEAVRRTLHRLRLRRAATAGTLPDDLAPPAIVARSEAMRRVFAQVARAGFSPATVLITGESGTGKELVARAIHDGCPRASGPFVPVTLLESELFGHVKGAFTGADRNRTGYFQAAHGGTIFLDELSETSPAAQLKLLRVLQDREVYPVGSSQAQRVDVRVIAATNKDLASLMAQGDFREDLYYRINILPIHMPPLRARGDDVLLLAAHFTEQYAAEIGRAPLQFTDEVLAAFLGYAWPGNVRELQNVIQQLVVMKVGDLVTVADLPSSMKPKIRPKGSGRSLSEVEAEHIRAVLLEVGGNKAEAARILGIDRKTLYAKIRRYGLG